MSQSVLEVSRRGSIAVLNMVNAPVNALSTRLIAAYNKTLDELLADKSLRVLHIRSGLKVFGAGADLAEMRANLSNPNSVDAQIDAVRGMQDVLFRIEKAPLATIAEISGAAMGGGLELALACDFRIAANEAKIALPETNLGLLPGAGGTQRLTNLCGRAIAKRLILGAEILDGAKAADLGVVHWAVPRAELIAFGDALADRVGALPRAAVAAAKACIDAYDDPNRNGYEDELSATRDLLLHEPETKSRVEAFLAGGK